MVNHPDRCGPLTCRLPGSDGSLAQTTTEVNNWTNYINNVCQLERLRDREGGTKRQGRRWRNKGGEREREVGRG